MVLTFQELPHMELPLTSEFSSLLPEALRTLDAISCRGGSNSVYALHQAREELLRAPSSNPERIVVLVTSGLPSTVTANWPVRTQADLRMVDRRQVMLPPSACADNQGRHFPDPAWAAGGSMPLQTGALAELRPVGLVGPLLAIPAERHFANGISASLPDGSCGFKEGLASRHVSRDIAYLPETDISGALLEGRAPLVRFDSGPYRGRLRPDSLENIQSVLSNLLENTLTRLVHDGIHVVVVHFNPREEPPESLKVLNMADPSAWNMLISLHDEQQMPGAIAQIRAVLGRAESQ